MVHVVVSQIHLACELTDADTAVVADRVVASGDCDSRLNCHIGTE